jgi:hypothetical protein
MRVWPRDGSIQGVGSYGSNSVSKARLRTREIDCNSRPDGLAQISVESAHRRVLRRASPCSLIGSAHAGVSHPLRRLLCRSR